jgi:peptidoglycan biosynthesis protein MviN/MurJ (putative lipid II flippase)
MVVFFLGFFTLLTNFFYSQSLPRPPMLVALLGLLTALVNAHMPVGRPPPAACARRRAALLGAP